MYKLTPLILLFVMKAIHYYCLGYNQVRLGNLIYLQNLLSQEKILDPKSGTIFFVAKITVMEDVC
jgi:hypothetical protein